VNPEEKKDYLKRYKEKKAEGELFWPDAIAKDAVVSLAIFVVLICLVVFAGVPSEPPANPSDTAYIPRPEWYFMWAFQLLKYFPGQLEGIAILGLGLVIFVGLFGLPFFDRGPKRHPRNRPIATIAMILIVAGMVFLTVQAVVTTPVSEAEGKVIGGTKAEQVKAGSELFAKNCADCHGAEGEGGEIKDKPGETTRPLNSEDFLVAHFDDTIFQIISYGQPGEGMQAFGPAYGGPLNDQEIRAIIAFLRSWAEPEEETPAGGDQAVADLAKIENPSFAKDVKPIFDQKCLNCHGKRVKGGFKVDTYENVMTSGDNAPVIVAGDAANSTLPQMLHGIKTPAGGQMPPGKPLKKEQIDLIERWINQGAQNN
jgi:menaquinol-cytochrome c reductase cytochrome b/c subunit